MYEKQEAANYKLCKEEGKINTRHRCPHCQNENNDSVDGKKKRSVHICDEVGRVVYETNRDRNRERAIHSWTEDHVCLNCNRLFSMENGC